MKKVIIFGTFDIIHAGHENLFAQARKHGDYIIAVIARDKTVKNIKSTEILNNEDTRLKNLKKTELADKVILGDLNDKYSAIRKFKPEVIALGYDQFAFTYGLKKLLIDIGLDTQIIRLKPYNPDVYKSTLLRERHHQALEDGNTEETIQPLLLNKYETN